MKDITDDVITKMTPEEKKRRKQISEYGQNVEMSDEVFDAILNNHKFYDMDGVQDILENYKLLLKKSKMPKELMNDRKKFAFGALGKQKRGVVEFGKLFKQYGDIYTEYTAAAPSIMDLLKGNILNLNIVYLSDVMLDNFEAITTPLISLYKFDIIDRRGIRMEGAMIYDSYMNNIMGLSEQRFIESREKLEGARDSMRGTSFSIQGIVLEEEYRDSKLQKKKRPKRLLVTRINGDGRGKEVPPPTIMVR